MTIRRIVALCILLPLAVSGCDAAVSAPEDAATFEPPPISTAATQIFKQNVKVPFSQVAFVPCAAGGAGEDVLIEGTLHNLIHVIESSSGNLNVKLHFQPQGARGTGLTTGDTYNGVGVTQEKLNVQADGFPVVLSLPNNFRLIGPGDAVSFHVHETIHMTINDNGDVTADVEVVKTTCG